jgi:sulfide:quinone oxidoreductase
MAHVVVIGAGLGGLPTAYELSQLLPSQHRGTLISDQPKFTFTPGLVRVALDVDLLNHFQLDLDPYAGHLGISDVKQARRLTEALLHKREVEVITNAAGRPMI